MKEFKEEQGLDQYVLMFEQIYEPIQNVERDFNQVLARLLEAIAECSQYVNKHNQKGLADNLPKVFSWYCSLVHKSRVRDGLSNAAWRKFPACCPYCLTSPCTCSRGRKSLSDNSEKLEKKAQNIDSKPNTLYEWQRMFSDLYPRDIQGYDQKSNFAHLIEEMGEASEAYRIRYFQPTALESELADILTWIFGMANLLDIHARDGGLHSYSSYNLEHQVFERYRGHCPDCHNIPCSCVSHQSRQKISELNVIYPSQILNAIEKSKIEIQDSVKNIFRDPEVQNLLVDMRKMIDSTEVTEEKVKDLFDKLVEEPKYRKWYQKITLEGIAESGIVSALTVLMQSAIL